MSDAILVQPDNPLDVKPEELRGLVEDVMGLRKDARKFECRILHKAPTKGARMASEARYAVCGRGLLASMLSGDPRAPEEPPGFVASPSDDPPEVSAILYMYL
jgi:hypothetical protein